MKHSKESLTEDELKTIRDLESTYKLRWKLIELAGSYNISIEDFKSEINVLVRGNTKIKLNILIKTDIIEE